MRSKNEDIHLFILEENRKRNTERVSREKILGEWLHGPIGQSQAISQEICNEKTMLRSQRNPMIVEKQESDLGMNEYVENAVRGIERLEADAFEFEQKDSSLKIGLGISTVIIGCSLVSIFALLRLDAVVHGDLYSYGLQFSLEWAEPYWIAIRTAIGLLWSMIGVAVLFQIHALRQRHKGKETKGHWKTCRLADESAIRLRTVVRGVKRLNKCGCNGKPVYLIKADNAVEIVED